MYNYLQDDAQAYVVTEVCYGGTLEQFLRVSILLDSLQQTFCVMIGLRFSSA